MGKSSQSLPSMPECENINKDGEDTEN